MFLFFSEFLYFYKYFQSIFLWNQKWPKQTICIPEGRLNVFIALSHMVMSSAQRWVDNQCCRCVLLCPDLKTPISGDCSDLTVWYVGICDVKCWILLTCFVNMTIYDLEIQLFPSFLTFSYFQLRSVGYIASHNFFFSKLTTLKMSQSKRAL